MWLKLSWNGCFSKTILHFLTTKTPSTPRSYEYEELQYSWRSPRLGGKTKDYLLKMALGEEKT
jgi:hypothetical protein